MVQISEKNCRFRQSRSGVYVQGKWEKSPPPPPPPPLSHPLSKDEGLKDIGHIMSIGNLILDVKIVTVSYLMHCDSLLQNVKDSIKKCYSYFITKCDRSLLQNASALLWQFYYKIATVIKKCDNFITKWHSYYKMRLLLQIAV